LQEEVLSTEEADKLVLEHQGWAESIARSVARSWNMDWKLDGLDGAALEALIFCARRFQPDRGVPFRGYSRRRIHEASTEAARQSRGWTRGMGVASRAEKIAREVSAELYTVFPGLRAGQLPVTDERGDDDTRLRGSVRQLLVGASMIAAKQGISTSLPDEVMDYKRMIELLATLEPVHQSIMWEVYWEGNSMRGVAAEWGIDELNVIREHQALLPFLEKAISSGKVTQKLKVRPGLKNIALKMKKKDKDGPFKKLTEGQQ